MSNVIEVQPKTVRNTHRGVTYTITFDKPTGRWLWHFERPVAPLSFDGTASKLHIAEREVKHKIDKVLE